MALPVPTRKQRFNAALQLAGITLREWCSERDVTVTHVNYVLSGERDGSAELNEEIDGTISKYLGKVAATAR